MFLKMNLSNRIACGTGVFLLIFGIITGFMWPFVFEYVLKKKLQLSPSSESYKLWLKTPIPMYLDIYLFNWTNSQEFLKNKNIKPEFEEIGPFVFKEVHQRVDISWNKNSSISYNQTRTWTFVPEESLDLSTPVMNLNVIVTTVTKMASGYNDLTKLLLDFLNFIYKEELLIARPAREWLFDGIRDKLLDFIKLYIDIPFDKFGWFYQRNLSSVFDGRFTVSTGQDDIFRLGAMEKWNYVNKTSFYDGECGFVKGSSGEIFSPLNGWKNNLSIFVTDFCGPLMLKYSGLESVSDLDGYRYIGDDSVFDNGTSNPYVECFCTGECSPSGVRNVTSCRKAPLFISFPHFYLADPVYSRSIKGMSPSKDEHEFYISIDPLTGLPLEVRAQLQLNVLLEPLRMFPMFKDVPRVYIPMMWFRQRAKITPDLAFKGKALRTFKKIGLWLACGLGIFGLLIIIVSLCLLRFFARNKQVELLITSEEVQESEPLHGHSECER